MKTMMTAPRRTRGGDSTEGPDERWYSISGESWDDGTHAIERRELTVAPGSLAPAAPGWVAVFQHPGSGETFTRPVAAWAEAYPVTEWKYRRPPWVREPLPVGLLSREPLHHKGARRPVGLVCRETDGALVPAEGSAWFVRHEFTGVTQ